MAGELDKRIQRLEDLEEIRQLFVDYGYHLDNRDWVRFSQLFAENGEVILAPLGRAVGPRAIEALMTRGLANTRGLTFHVIANPIVTLDGERADSDVTWAMIMRTPEDRPVLAMLGHHRDALTKEGGRWKFLRREGILEVPSTFPGSPTLTSDQI